MYTHIYMILMTFQGIKMEKFHLNAKLMEIERNLNKILVHSKIETEVLNICLFKCKT